MASALGTNRSAMDLPVITVIAGSSVAKLYPILSFIMTSINSSSEKKKEGASRRIDKATGFV